MVTGFFSNIFSIGGQATVTKIESESDSDMDVSTYFYLNIDQEPKDSDRLDLE